MIEEGKIEWVGTSNAQMYGWVFDL